MGTPTNTSPSSAELEQPSVEKIHAELKAWAQTHQRFLEVFLDSYVIVDPFSKVVDFNVAFTELVGESFRKILKIGLFADLLKTEFGVENCPAKQVISSRKLVRLDELTGSTKAYPELQLIMSGVPIFTPDDQLIGAFLTIRNVSAESELQKKYDERKRESSTDGLTKLYNKVFTEAMLLRGVVGQMRGVTGLSVALTDIDFFKKVNDTYGHSAGDYVLALVASILKGVARDTDIVGRFGGEEFMVLLANADKNGAKAFAERFRTKVQNTKFEFEGKTIPVTVSIGTATLTDADKAAAQQDAAAVSKEMVNRADYALYYSKANGRNQTSQHEDLTVSADKDAALVPQKKPASGGDKH